MAASRGEKRFGGFQQLMHIGSFYCHPAVDSGKKLSQLAYHTGAVTTSQPS
jgi:hypothetical protein